MKLFTIAQIEIKKSIKAVLMLSLFMALLVTMVMAIFDPELFAGLEGVLDAYPDAIKELLGSVIDLGTIMGYFTIEFLSLIWVWLGIYFVLKGGQDIPSTIENQTIDLILSKPLKRWEFILGRYLRILISVFIVLLTIGICSVIMIEILPNLQDQDVNYVELFWGLTWAYLFIVSLATTAFFFSVFLNRKRATSLAFGMMVVFFVIGTFYNYFDDNIKEIKRISLFFYYDPARILVGHSYVDVLRDFLVLFGYSVVLVISAIVIFNKRDIPV
jgi:ABC-2 type transport system permease protein